MSDELKELIKNSQYDLELISTKINEYSNKFNYKYFAKCKEEYGENYKIDFSSRCDRHIEIYSDLAILLLSIYPSYIAPAYHFNNYLDDLYVDVYWDELKYNSSQKYVSSGLRSSKIIVSLQSVLISIKTALDRLVALFRYYYQGISRETTFGRIPIDSKPKGFMGVVYKYFKTDELLEYILNEYNDWIKDALLPRDIIIHYKDCQNTFVFDSELSLLIPLHTFTRENQECTYSFVSIHEYCKKWYDFFEYIMEYLSNKKP